MTPASPGAPALSVETTQLAPAGFATVTPVYVIVPEPSAHISSPETLFSMVPVPVIVSVVSSVAIPLIVAFSFCTGLDVPDAPESSVGVPGLIFTWPNVLVVTVPLQWALLHDLVTAWVEHVNAVVPLAAAAAPCAANALTSSAQ